MKSVPHNLYIHVPYCQSKCNYCAFFSHACAHPNWDAYTEKICSEIIFWGQSLGKTDVPTIFFGGGTPSLMPVDCFGRIIKTIEQHFNILPDAEITLESNPGTLDAGRLRDFYVAGVNRLSIGVQALSDERLLFLGRRHSVADAMGLLDSANNLGLRVSADFIYGLPGDTVADIIELCQSINKLSLTHCSLYELSIEPGTPFWKMGLDMPDNEAMLEMYVAIADNLRLPRYEVSNYALPSCECRHNLNVWDGGAYIGIGSGGAGRIYMNDQWYEQNGGDIQYRPMTEQERAIEHVLTGMRTLRGCRLTDAVKSVIDMDWVNQHPMYVQIKNNRISATSQGLLILDALMLKLVR